MSDASQDGLTDGEDPVDHPELEDDIVPMALTEDLEVAEHDAKESGVGGLDDPDLPGA